MLEIYKSFFVLATLIVFAIIFGAMFASAVRYRLSKENELTPLSDPLWIEVLWMLIPCLIVFAVVLYTYHYSLVQERQAEISQQITPVPSTSATALVQQLSLRS